MHYYNSGPQDEQLLTFAISYIRVPVATFTTRYSMFHHSIDSISGVALYDDCTAK